MPSNNRHEAIRFARKMATQVVHEYTDRLLNDPEVLGALVKNQAMIDEAECANRRIIIDFMSEARRKGY